MSLTRRLYPKGRAFRIPFNGYLESLHKALANQEVEAFNDAIGVLKSILPDTADFTADDATDWERRLGLISNTSVSLSDRKKAIIRKMAFPGNIPARGSYLWLQKQLRDAGFDVYVYENRFDDYPSGYITMQPEDVYGTDDILTDIDHGDMDHGDLDLGEVYNNIIANSITQEGDMNFSPGDNLRSTFFIGGSTIGTYASVSAIREVEFRQLILRTKPLQAVGFLFINYV